MAVKGLNSDYSYFFMAFIFYVDIYPMKGYLYFYGTWRSLVAHLNGVQGVAGSIPVVPTIFKKDSLTLSFFHAFYLT